jgi:hypothetical protein
LRQNRALVSELNGIVSDFRKVIILLDGLESLNAAMQERCTTTGRMIYRRKQETVERLNRRLTEEYRQSAQSGFRKHSQAIGQFIQYLSQTGTLHDADKLAFLDVVEELDAALPRTSNRRNWPAGDLHALKDNLQSIQLGYREEVARIFSRLATRGQSGVREKWDSYVRFLRGIANREQILAEMSDWKCCISAFW